MAEDSSIEYLQSIFGLKGRTVLITGGTRGIGKGLTIALASAGASIVLLARNPTDPTVLTTISEINALGRQAHVYKCDLSSRTDVLSVVPTVCTRDKLTIDIIVHSGGIQHRAEAASFPDSKWDDILAVNLTAGYTLTREFAQHWLTHELFSFSDTRDSQLQRKKVLFIGSVTTFSGSVQIPAYVSTKGAITSLTRALSNEWMARGINVNCVAPGYIETELTSGIRDDGEKERAVLDRVPAGRWGRPEELAGAVVHLCSRGSDFVSGETYVVDGGFNGR